MFGKGECGGWGKQAFAHGPFGGFASGPMKWGPFAGMFGDKCGPAALLNGLDLTDEQLLQIAELKGKALGKFARAKLDLMETKKEIFKELLQSQVDRNKVKSLADQAKARKSECVDSMLDNVIALSEIVTPEQKKKLRLNLVRKFLGFDELGDE